MATSSQKSSLIPTSTFTSGDSSPTNDPNGGGESISDLLSSSGSPPLIVAFLAIGLFVIAMIAVFIWRRITQSHMPLQPVRTNAGSKPPLGERPILWDVWSDIHIHGQPAAIPTRWETTTPIAAIMTSSLSCVGPALALGRRPPIGSVDSDGRVLFGMLRCWVSAVKRFRVRAPPPPPSTTPPPLSVEEDKEVGPPSARTSDEVGWGDMSSLRVSVVIAMPNQRRCSGSLGEEADMLGEFCIGTTDMAWCECE